MFIGVSEFLSASLMAISKKMYSLVFFFHAAGDELKNSQGLPRVLNFEADQLRVPRVVLLIPASFKYSLEIPDNKNYA